jgi:hypothetical protein
MEKSDVVKIKSLLRQVTRDIEVFDKDTQESLGIKTVCYPIVVELDNSLGISEEVDNVLWNDDEGIIAALKVNSGDVRGANWAMGHNKIINSAQAYIADYGEIQQFRIVLDENGVSKLLEAIKTNGNFKYCKDSSEITLDDKAIARVIDNVCHAVQPERNIMKPKDYYSK